MADPTPADRRAPSGYGALLRTDYDHVDLGSHHGQALRARVQRRSLRLAVGRGRHLSLALGRTRPVSVEVIGAAGRYDIPVPAQPDPWLRVAARLALLWVASIVLVRVVRRLTASSTSAERGHAP
jgi:hypothetical protein